MVHRFKGTCFHILMAAVIALFAPRAMGSMPDPSGHEILILHSYHKGMLWTDAISRHLTDALRRIEPAVEIYEEYMDTKRYAGPEHRDRLSRLYRFKYTDRRLSAVVTSDDNAFRFALEHRDSLFPGTPIVFCGVNNLDVYRENVNHPLNNITGVVEAFDARTTLELALQLHPETQTVSIINDRTTTGRSNRMLLEALSREFSQRVNFQWLEDISMPALLDTIEHLPDRNLILLMSFNRDRETRVFSYLESIRLIAARANRPIYSVWGFYLGRGIVGGMLTSGASQGETAATLVEKILDGQPADTIPIIESSPNQAMFDHRLIERYGIPTDRLPPGSVIVNKSFRFYDRYKWYLWGGALVLIAELFIILLLVLNIRKRHRVEDHLNQSKERYRQIFENIQDAYYEVEMDGTIIEASPSIENVLGYPRTAFIGLQIQSLYVDPGARRPMLDLILNQRRIVDHELKLLNPSGTPVDIAISALIIGADNGRPAKIVGSLRDISRRKNAERTRQALQQELERSKRMEALGLLAGGVAHDLNNILSGIVTYPELLLLDTQLPPNIRETVATIQKSGQRAAAVVDDLVTISRGFAGHHHPLDLNAVVEEFLASPEHHDICQRYPESRLRKDLAVGLPAVPGSKIHVLKSLMNLVINGFEAIGGSGHGGEICIMTGQRQLASPVQGYETIQPGNYALLTVTDNGPGIPSKDIEHVFEPFYSKKILGRSGTGLGLTVVWNTMQDHRGHIDLQSNRRGTSFALYFPTTQEAPTLETKPQPVPIRRGHGESILVVDDEALQRQIASQLLSALGYRPTVVASGEAAVQYIKENHVDLVLLDMVMPLGMNGRETYLQMNRIRSGIKAIITSGFSENGDVRGAQEAGAGSFLHKPYTMEALAEAVHAILPPVDDEPSLIDPIQPKGDPT
jgi:two-component system, cell cycle sensor histidine kinase and response regulator CckA